MLIVIHDTISIKIVIAASIVVTGHYPVVNSSERATTPQCMPPGLHCRIALL